MSKNIEKQLKNIVHKIARKYRPDKIILFGSYAWGIPTDDSDVDLFIIKGAQNTRELAREIDGTIFPRLFPMDIIVYHPDDVEKRKDLGDSFIRDILFRGKVLYAK
jgi:predicted nucleotidyltransferase